MRLFRLLVLPLLIVAIALAQGGGVGARAGGCVTLRAETACIDPVLVAQAKALGGGAEKCPAVLFADPALCGPPAAGTVTRVTARIPAEGRPAPPPWRPPRALS